jgi:hypothetical protein
MNKQDSKFNYFGAFKLSILTLVLIVAGAALFSAFESHMINVTADLVQIDAPIMTPPGPVAFDNTTGGTFTGPITVFIVEFDPDATHVYYSFGPGSDPSTVADPVCGDIFGGPKNDVHKVDLAADAVIKAIACDGDTAGAHYSAVNAKIYLFAQEEVQIESNNDNQTEVETEEDPKIIEPEVTPPSPPANPGNPNI